MKKWLLLSVLFSCLLWGCQEEEHALSFRPDEGLKVTGSNASPVRTSIGDHYSILWSAGDAIALFPIRLRQNGEYRLTVRFLKTKV